jgi:shikimate kinase
MASGKSTVGPMLAARFNRQFIDLDRVIESNVGCAIAELIAREGEERFRQIETETLRDVASRGGAVIAPGGGAITRAENRELMAKLGITVWLDAPFELCWTRIEKDGATRPLAPNESSAGARYEQRLALYRQATVHIPIGESHSPEDIAEAIIEELKTQSELHATEPDTNSSEKQADLWDRLTGAFEKYAEMLGEFFSEGVDRVALIRQAVRMRDNTPIALNVACLLKEDEHKQLFDLWVAGASYHKSVHIYRKFILALPRDWVLERIEAEAEPLLLNGDLEEYRRFLELFLLLDEELTRKLALRALAHSDPEVVEAGQDFLEILGDKDWIKSVREHLSKGADDYKSIIDF